MQKKVSVVVFACLIVLACLPWLTQLTRTRPLVPESLSQARAEYDTMVGTAQAATREAERSQQSRITIRVVGTVERMEQETPAPATEEPTAELDVVPTLTPESTTPAANNTSGVATPRLGMNDVTDIITEAMITAQIQQDMQDNSVQNLVITLTPDGVRGSGTYVAAAGVQQPLQIMGGLDIEYEGLIVRITSIKVGDIDVTADQRAGLERRLNTSIYRLLPERFVQSYQLEQGQVVVQSRKRR